MFANFLRLTARRAPDYASGFVREVTVVRGATRNRRLERLFLICWVLIAIKCAAIAWAVHHYHVPFNAMWVIAPTLAFAALVTWVYWRRN